MIRDHKMVAVEKFLMSEQGHKTGKLLDGTKCQILLDTAARKSFMSKLHYLHCNLLNSFPKIVSKIAKNSSG